MHKMAGSFHIDFTMRVKIYFAVTQSKYGQLELKLHVCTTDGGSRQSWYPASPTSKDLGMYGTPDLTCLVFAMIQRVHVDDLHHVCCIAMQCYALLCSWPHIDTVQAS